jgi:hypothetical protein
MKKSLLILLFPVFSFSSFALAGKRETPGEPLFQISGGIVHSSIDLSRYNSSINYRGLQARLVTHLGSAFFLSAEYTNFPEHESPSSWTKIHTHKIDLNGHVSFATTNNRTRIFGLLGVGKHEWKGTRTKYTDLDQLGKGLPEGTVVSVNRWGVNAGVGFTQVLYDNISLFGDFRFNFSNAHNWERIRIMDVMTTFGISFSIPYPEQNNRRRSFGIGKKIYKWTEKGAK